MSDERKYYYLKLKDNYFDQDCIKVLEAQPNGYLYSLIILKLYLRACKYGGKLMMTEAIAYQPEAIPTLSRVIGHDKDHVQQALEAGIHLGLITITDSREIWMTLIQDYIGHSSTESDRKREYRAKITGKWDNVPRLSRQSPLEIEIDIERELKREIEIDPERELDYENIL